MTAIEVEKILRATRKALEEGHDDVALDQLEAALRKYPSITKSGVPTFAQAYTETILTICDRHPGPKRHVTSPEQEVYMDRLIEFVGRNFGIIQPSAAWLERMLRQRNSRAFASACKRIAKLRLAQSELSAGTVEEVMVQATRRHDFETVHHAASLLHEHLMSNSSEELVTRVEPWCMVGDSMLMQDDNITAEHCYAQASALDNRSLKAILGNACVALDRGDLDRACGRLLEAADAASAGHKNLIDILSTIRNLWIARATTPSVTSFEVIIFCHVTEKLRKYAHLAPPSVGLVKAALHSLRTSFVGLNTTVPVTVFYDHRDTEINRAYLRTLLNFCDAEGIGLVVNSEHGLRRQWLHAFHRTRADVVFVLEQDHEFIRPCPGLAEVSELLAHRPDLNHLRINRRDNLPFLFDAALSQTSCDRKDGLSRTGRFANTPHFIRRDFYRAVIHPIIEKNSKRDMLNFGAGGVEESVNKVIAEVEEVIGLPAAVRLFGLSIYGHPGAKALARHLGL